MPSLKVTSQCVLVTGAKGFVGSHVVNSLLKSGHSVKVVARNTWSDVPHGAELIVADLSLPVDWGHALDGVTTIIHLAARVHQTRELQLKAIEEFRNINTRATLELAVQAAQAGVKRFIYLSTIAINGTFSGPNEYFTEQSEPKPKSSYAISKYEAELGLQKLSQQSPMEVVLIRPPMIYGENAPGNFSRLVSLVKTGIPLPFRLANNLRSFIFIENLVSFVMACIEHPAAANELFLISDGDDLSLNDLIDQISKNLMLNSKMLPVPLGFLEIVLRLLGKGGLTNQLFRPMRIDIHKARKFIGWIPPFSSSSGLSLSIGNDCPSSVC